jgi:hypothetical protein
VKVNRRFGETYHLHLHGGKVRSRRSRFTLFLLGLFFESEDGNNTFMRNFGWLSIDYIREDNTLHNRGCQDLRSCKEDSNCNRKECFKAWSSTWGTRKHLTSVKSKHRNCLSFDPRNHEDLSPNLSFGMPETSSTTSLTGQNHVNNW